MKAKSHLIIEQIEIGPMGNFQYFIGDQCTQKIAVVDPAWDVTLLKEKAKKKNLQIVMVLLTHGHPDHVNGLEDLLKTHDIPIVISKHEASFYTPKNKNIKKVLPDEKLRIGEIEISCLHTPGHTPGSQCFLVEGHLITGDTLFIDGCGRCDLPGGDAEQMYATLHHTLWRLPDSTVIYPGHHYADRPFDTLGEQKKTNPFLRTRNLEDFLRLRGGLG